jgi:hypothetical protein
MQMRLVGVHDIGVFMVHVEQVYLVRQQAVVETAYRGVSGSFVASSPTLSRAVGRAAAALHPARLRGNVACFARSLDQSRGEKSVTLQPLRPYFERLHERLRARLNASNWHNLRDPAADLAERRKKE